MDIDVLMTEIEKIRRSILNGNVYPGINQLLRLKKSSSEVDISLVEDILNLTSLERYLYDQTSMGDASSAVQCLAALKKLNLDIDSTQINYIRYKKLSLMGMDIDSYFSKARPAFQKLLKTLQSFFSNIGDYRECVISKSESRITFEEDIILRFPNPAFRDIFLQLAFQQAIEFGLSFHWENHHSILNQDLTGKISWSLIQIGKSLDPQWYRSVKERFDTFILSLQDKLERLDLPRYLPSSQNQDDQLWMVFSRDGSISQRLSSALRNYKVIQIKDIKLLQQYMKEESEHIGSFIFHVTVSDFDVIHTIIEQKLSQPTCGAPYIIFADMLFFKVMKKHSLLFPGCEHVAAMNPENIQNLEFIVSKVIQSRRRFIRLPVGMDCRVTVNDVTEHTQANPVSVGGAYVKTQRIMPVFSHPRISLLDKETGFEETLSGDVVYNGKGGSAIRFDNIIPFEKFQKLREISLNRHHRLLDTFKRSRL